MRRVAVTLPRTVGTRQDKAHRGSVALPRALPQTAISFRKLRLFSRCDFLPQRLRHPTKSGTEMPEEPCAISRVLVVSLRGCKPVQGSASWLRWSGAGFVVLALALSGCQFGFTVRIGPLEEEKVIEESDNTQSWADKIRPLDPRCRSEPCGI